MKLKQTSLSLAFFFALFLTSCGEGELAQAKKMRCENIKLSDEIRSESDATKKETLKEKQKEVSKKVGVAMQSLYKKGKNDKSLQDNINKMLGEDCDK